MTSNLKVYSAALSRLDLGMSRAKTEGGRQEDIAVIQMLVTCPEWTTVKVMRDH